MGNGVKIVSVYDYVMDELKLKNLDDAKFLLKDKFSVENVPILLQRNYGERNDCTVTSIATIMAYFSKLKDYEVVYNKVVDDMKPKWAYGSYGTIPILINIVINNLFKSFNINKKSNSRYLKYVGFSFNDIKKYFKYTKYPLILSLYKANDGYYKNHSVTVLGYYEFGDYYTDKKVQLLEIRDNWNRNIRYIDFNKLHWLCLLNYFE